MLSVRASTLGVYQRLKVWRLWWVRTLDCKISKEYLSLALASTKIGTLHHISHNLILVFASRMDALHSLSPDCPLVTLCPWAGGGGRHWSLMQARASKSSLLGIHTSNLVLSAPNGLRKKSPDFKGHSPVRACVKTWSPVQLSPPLFSNTTRRGVPDTLPITMYLYAYPLRINCLDSGNDVIKPFLRREKEQQLLAYSKMVKVEPEPVENWREKGRLIQISGL